MKECPILFKGPMVRAIIEGRKTQTRRVVKHQPPSAAYQLATCISTTGDRKNEGKQHWIKLSESGYSVLDSTHPYFSCPFGQPGDRLWVREAVRIPDTLEFLAYKADLDTSRWNEHVNPINCRWTPSIHMRREYSRITLEVTAIRVERLQDISEKDAEAEGAVLRYDDPNRVDRRHPKYSEGFKTLWQSINGPGSWAENPWVWVVEFKRVTS